MSSKYLDRVDTYAADIVSGAVPSCRMVRLACERYENDKKRADLYFDASKFLRFVRFAQTLKHFKGEFAGKAIRLEDWQLFVAANVFGWYRKATKRRRYQYADIYVPRKNGKTTFAAIVALYMLLFDGEPAAEVYAAAEIGRASCRERV